MDKIKVGISSCLLGEEVRYNGGHALNRYVRDTLGHYFDYVPVCPEVECGLPTPREAMRLIGDPDKPRLVTSRSGVDLTEKMLTWSSKRVKSLAKEDLCGFIFKSKSPSSGALRVKIYNQKGYPAGKGAGLFARDFMRNHPLIPIEEEGRLNDMKLRENFIERVFVYDRFRKMVTNKTPFKIKDLISFHTIHKLQILSHSTNIYRTLGKLVADSKKLAKAKGTEAFLANYEAELSEAMHLKTTPAKNSNVLQHILGYFKKQLTADEKQEILEHINHYREGYTPLIVPMTLLNHYIRKYQEPYLLNQTYLNPHPLELQLRNHA